MLGNRTPKRMLGQAQCGIFSATEHTGFLSGDMVSIPYTRMGEGSRRDKEAKAKSITMQEQTLAFIAVASAAVPAHKLSSMNGEVFMVSRRSIQ